MLFEHSSVSCYERIGLLITPLAYQKGPFSSWPKPSSTTKVVRPPTEIVVEYYPKSPTPTSAYVQVDGQLQRSCCASLVPVESLV